MTPMISATCCFQGVASTSWPVLRSCRLLFAIVATAEHDRGHEQGEGDESWLRGGRQLGAYADDQEQRSPDHGQDADARERTVRRADEPRHVAADGGDEEAHERDVHESADHEHRHVGGRAHRAESKFASSTAIGTRQTSVTSADHADRDVALSSRQERLFAGAPRA